MGLKDPRFSRHITDSRLRITIGRCLLNRICLVPMIISYVPSVDRCGTDCKMHGESTFIAIQPRYLLQTQPRAQRLVERSRHRAAAMSADLLPTAALV